MTTSCQEKLDSLIDILDEACSKVSLKQTTSEKEIYNLNEEYHKIKKQKEELQKEYDLTNDFLKEYCYNLEHNNPRNSWQKKNMIKTKKNI